VLSLRKCSFRYPGVDRWALRDVDLDVAGGEIIHVKGRNGSGKSTLLKVASGLLTPTAGRRTNAARAVYMDQSADAMLAFDMTVAEQLSAFAYPKKQTVASPGDRLRDFAVQLEDRLDDFVGHISGGQRQIVALLAILEAGAELLCLDEFLSALDARSAAVATTLIQHVVDSKKVSVLAVSHSSAAGLRCDREVYLDPPVRGVEPG
jgi:ABC-type Mn2+/Zn2+ transport system ATPase subunit